MTCMWAPSSVDCSRASPPPDARRGRDLGAPAGCLRGVSGVWQRPADRRATGHDGLQPDGRRQPQPSLDDHHHDHHHLPAEPVITDNRVFLVGDSITESISSRYSGAVCDALNPLGWDVTVDAVMGRQTADAVQSLRAHLGDVGQVMVVLIGHNDGIDPTSYKAQLDRLIALVPDVRRIYLLTNYQFEKGRDRMNAVLQQEAAADGAGGPDDRIELVDWNTVVSGVKGAIRQDGLHLTSIGQEALAGTIASDPRPGSGRHRRPPRRPRWPATRRPAGGGRRRRRPRPPRRPRARPSGPARPPAARAPATAAPAAPGRAGPAAAPAAAARRRRPRRAPAPTTSPGSGPSGTDAPPTSKPGKPPGSTTAPPGTNPPGTSPPGTTPQGTSPPAT